MQVTAEGIRLLQYVATRVTPVRDYTGSATSSSTKCKTCPSLAWNIIKLLFPLCKIHGGGDTFQSFSTATTIFTLEKRHPELVDLIFANRTLTHPQLSNQLPLYAQISRFANGILGWPLDKNVFPRSGAEVAALRTRRPRNGALKHVTGRKSKGYHTTAILCRTMDEAKALYQQLDQDDIALLEDSSESLGSRFVLTTIQVAKGMEFDEVIIWNATDRSVPYDERTNDAVHHMYTCKTPALTNHSSRQREPLYQEFESTDETNRAVEF